MPSNDWLLFDQIKGFLASQTAQGSVKALGGW